MSQPTYITAQGNIGGYLDHKRRVLLLVKEGKQWKHISKDTFPLAYKEISAALLATPYQTIVGDEYTCYIFA